jgi:adenylate cyclase
VGVVGAMAVWIGWMSLSPAVGFPSVSPPDLINRTIGANPHSPLGWAILLGGLVALATAYMVAASSGLLRPGSSTGALFGLALWLVTGAVLMPLMGIVSPDQTGAGSQMRMRGAAPVAMRESFMMLHLGILAPVGALIAWVLFGVVLGAASSVFLRGGKAGRSDAHPIHGAALGAAAIVPMGERWRAILAGETPLSFGPRLGRRLFSLIPSPWRCRFCNAPFRGPYAGAFRWVGYRPSRKNPQLCARCLERAPEGGALVPVTVLFADVRGYTTLAEGLSSVEATSTLNRFYEAASQALLAHEAVLGQIAGDEVMALFVPGLAGRAYSTKAVRAAHALLAAVGYGSPGGSWLDVGIGICSGEEYVGNVGGGGFKDFTALGDVTNTAARLEAVAAGGDILLCADTYAAVRDEFPDADRQVLDLKGKRVSVEAFLIRSSRSTDV